MSEPDDVDGSDAVEEEATPLQRALDLLVFAPVGIALTVAEDLPGLIGKGHRRFETDVQNARIVGRIVVAQGQRHLVERVGKLLHLTSSDGTDDVSDPTAPTAPTDSTEGAEGAEGAQKAQGAAAVVSARPTPSPKPQADPADEIIVEGALAGYDTLSASQVVRRLESLGPADLEALKRYEASHRNRHTILNRAHQILGAIEAAKEATTSHPALSGFDTPGSATPVATPSDIDSPARAVPQSDLHESVAPETVIPATPPPAATGPEPDRSGE